MFDGETITAADVPPLAHEQTGHFDRNGRSVTGSCLSCVSSGGKCAVAKSCSQLIAAVALISFPISGRNRP
jgi:hypothetical protein